METIRINPRAILIGLLFALAVLTNQSLCVAETTTHVQAEAVAVINSDTVVTPPKADTVMHITFALTDRNEDSAADYADALNDSSSPLYHHWLTPAQYGGKFGAAPKDIDQVLAFLTTHGFAHIKLWSNRQFITADTTRSQAEATFNVHIVGCRRSDNEVRRGYSPTYYAPDREPSVDIRTAMSLDGIFGLSNIAQRVSKSVKGPQALTINLGTGLTPADLESVYDSAPLHEAGYNGRGLTIGIFSPTAYNGNDVASFLAYNKIIGANINVINVNGGTTDLAYNDEACLDIETAIGQAPGATIYVYEGPNDGSLDIYQKMAEDNPNIVTNSYGIDENLVNSAYVASYESLRLQMATQGISIFVASGDNGAFDDVDQKTVTTSVDATSAYVTAVGGTELTSPSLTSWDGEIAWTYNDSTLGSNTGSGGGLSTFVKQPPWQTGPGVDNSFSNGFRQIPDVAAVASTPYYYIYTNGSFNNYGGTSAAAPFWAGSIAVVEQLLGQRLGNIDPLLYKFGTSDSSVYHDIVSGNNGVYQCTTGWDFVTGWGSADFGRLAEAFESDLASGSGTSLHQFGSGLQMFSIPFEYASSDPEQYILSGLITPAGASTDQIAAWLPASDDYAVTPTAPANLPVPGQGYWGRFSSSGGALLYKGAAIAGPTYSISISPGWNMIGDPYSASVPISSLELAASGSTISLQAAGEKGDLSPTLYDYNGTSYEPHGLGDSIVAYDGYWLRSYVSGSLIFTSP